MPKYRILFPPDVEFEILVSWEWGVSAWGKDAAEGWLRELYEGVFERLSVFPYSFSLAPESSELGSEIRQLVFGRYRLLFEVIGDTVTVLHLAGPYHL